MEFLLGLILGLIIGRAMRNGAQLSAPKPTVAIPEADHAPQPKSWVNTDIRNLDNSSVLLYFGAFLMVAGVGLFAGLSHYSGAIKTVAVLCMALTFYVAGLFLYKKVSRLKPAAVTLTAIGLFCLPLTGAAAYIYLAGQISGSTIWFMTSVLSLLFYIVALWQIRQSLIGYMSVFMCLSVWLSAVAVIEAPIHYFGWAMILLGMSYLLATKYLRLWPEVEVPLSVSASIMVPVAFGGTLLFGMGNISLFDQGITALLAALFYGLATWLEPKEELRLVYFVLGYSLVPITALLLLSDKINDWAMIAFALVTVAAIQMLLVIISRKILATWRDAAFSIGALTLAVAAVLCASTGEWRELAILLGINLVAHAAIALGAKSKIHMGLGLLTAVVLPMLVGFLVFEPQLPAGYISLAYIALALGFMIAGRLLGSFGYSQMVTIAYWFALGLAWLIGLIGLEGVPMMVSVAVAIVATLGAYYERQKWGVCAAVVLGGFALGQGLLWQDMLSTNNLTIGLTLLALAYYAVGKMHTALATEQFRPMAQVWNYAGVAGLYAAAIIPVVGWYGARDVTMNATVLILAGAVTCYESYVLRSRAGKYLGAAASLLGVQWLMFAQGVYDMQIYTHMWALYFAALAWLSHRDERVDEVQSFTLLALIIQTAPLALQALAGDTELGLLLLFESIGILLFGLWIRYRLVSWWGLSVAVASVLYQLREFQFFVLLLLGAGIIGAGVYLLLRQEKKS